MTHRYLMVSESILPDAIVKTVLAKELLNNKEVSTINEAVERVGLSRSAFYKYKDNVFPYHQLERERIVTLSLDLKHCHGMLSKVLQLISNYDGNVLTIHQTIPLQGWANVVVTIETSLFHDRLSEFLETIRALEGVSHAQIVGKG